MAIHASPALADGVAEAKERFDEAAKAYADHRYADAAESYERAAALSPHPAPLVNAADAWELDGNPVRAARACDQALRLPLAVDVRTGLERRLVRLERSVATLDVAGEAPLAVRVDDGAVIAPPARIRLSPGRHVVSLVDSAAATTRPETLVLTAGEHRNLTLQKMIGAPAPLGVTSTAAPAADAQPSRSPGPPLGTWIAGGVAVGAAGAATVFAILTSRAQSDFDAHPTDAGADDFEQKRLTTNVLFAVSGAALLTAGAFWLFTPRRAPARAAAVARGFVIRFD